MCIGVPKQSVEPEHTLRLCPRLQGTAVLEFMLVTKDVVARDSAMICEKANSKTAVHRISIRTLTPGQ